ncbi:hypothetical protein R3P38DRAFT_3274192 [Favolaschia claudopus]|uniref:Uncharacterized protein n=1 Tax=Favolaschia claudopus TaxID=2862362 RepID=A0AAW0B0C8_9AGAR
MRFPATLPITHPPLAHGKRDAEGHSTPQYVLAWVCPRRTLFTNLGDGVFGVVHNRNLSNTVRKRWWADPRTENVVLEPLAFPGPSGDDYYLIAMHNITESDHINRSLNAFPGGDPGIQATREAFAMHLSPELENTLKWYRWPLMRPRKKPLKQKPEKEQQQKQEEKETSQEKAGEKQQQSQDLDQHPVGEPRGESDEYDDGCITDGDNGVSTGDKPNLNGGRELTKANSSRTLGKRARQEVDRGPEISQVPRIEIDSDAPSARRDALCDLEESLEEQELEELREWVRERARILRQAAEIMEEQAALAELSGNWEWIKSIRRRDVGRDVVDMVESWMTSRETEG